MEFLECNINTFSPSDGIYDVKHYEIDRETSSKHYVSLPYYYNHFYSSYFLGKTEYVDGDQPDPFGHTIG